MKKSLIFLFSILLCSSCTDIESINKEQKVIVHFYQYAVVDYMSDYSGFWGSEIKCDFEVEYEYNYLLTWDDAENVMVKNNTYVPPLHGDGYYSFLSLYTTKTTSYNSENESYFEFSNKYRDSYLTQNIDLYYGIVG